MWNAVLVFSLSSLSHWIKQVVLIRKAFMKPAGMCVFANLSQNWRKWRKEFPALLTSGQMLHFSKCLCGEVFHVAFGLRGFVAFKRTNVVVDLKGVEKEWKEEPVPWSLHCQHTSYRVKRILIFCETCDWGFQYFWASVFWVVGTDNLTFQGRHEHKGDTALCISFHMLPNASRKLTNVVS